MDIRYNEFHIDFSQPYSSQIDALCEDLFQMYLGQGRMLDIGWFPEFDPNGCFLIQVIQGADWLNPISRVSTRNESELREAVDAAIIAHSVP